MKGTSKKRSKKAGLAPGTPVHVGEQKMDKSRITVISYDEKGYEENTISDISECFPKVQSSQTTWISVKGLHDIASLQQLATFLNIHALVVEDVVNTHQRPKVEEYDPYLFMVLKRVEYTPENQNLSIEQVSLILGPQFLLSFEEGPKEIFESVRNRIRAGKGRMRKLGADYLAYALLDSVVDHYFVVVEHLGEAIEILEEELVHAPKEETLQTLHRLKRDIITIRKTVWPLREIVASLERGDLPVLTPQTTLYFRDVYDHTIQVIEAVETYRDMLASILDLYLTTLSNRLNETMKVLTMMATVFIPLTLIAGIYGMNFKYMPELEWPWGYPVVLGIMAALAGGMLWFFKRKGWL